MCDLSLYGLFYELRLNNFFIIFRFSIKFCTYIVFFQALPLVTVIAGRQIPGRNSTIVTTCEFVDKPHTVVIEMPSRHSPIKALLRSDPKWSNYVRGIQI